MKETTIVFCFVLLLFCFPAISNAKDNKEPELISEAAFLLDSDTGAVLYEKNGYKKMYPASLTKIATAIYAIEHGKLDDIVTVSENAYSAEGTRVYLEKGEQVTLRHLLDGMLINSGNDAAIAIAEYLDGSISNFETNINKYLKEKVNVHSTHFKNPNGLFDKDHYTTANDLALITQYAMKNETFREIFGTDELKWDGLSWDTTLVSHHQMVNGSRPYDKVTGGKTGFVDESKQTLATTAENGELSLIAIILKGTYKQDVYNDTEELMDYGFSQYMHKLVPGGKSFFAKGTTYETSDEVNITVPRTKGKEEVSSSGVLMIKNENDDIIQSVQLANAEPAEETFKKNISDEAGRDEKKSSFPGIVFLIPFAIYFIYVIRKKAIKR
ncbi:MULTISPECIES: D-alanyl-D-alanine carboxypeptidase family protein [Niallia]|uniref:Peptidase S11 n=1 Tax=Niallia circulans TaxID=1397 RepID=A0A268FHS9_NIACI|nr:D-alanyl-D-alanine carboxypeptidase family protein [Niallia circulans]AYV66447.1 D-alanyl-D-alanine carboxypeptidase [Niallia circulans]AYV70735.1 D-alanyl-D-alanine carboxypeptidase [Niallia circulans]PAD84925.1 peptidase S11 [Niallia circulans]